jgi:hypothetical protein
MNDEFDIEKTLGKFRADPGADVKASVMSRFNEATTSGERDIPKAGFWRKKIPLYAVVASLFVFMVLSFYAGKITSRPEAKGIVNEEANQADEIISADDIKWTVAERDLL